MVDESMDILSSGYSEDEMMSIDDRFSKAFESVESCKKII